MSNYHENDSDVIRRMSNDLQIIKSSIVELKQRCDRIEHVLKMPDAGPKPKYEYPTNTAGGTGGR